jgi:autotransporter passenger strand-loop-strand repeat protein
MINSGGTQEVSSGSATNTTVSSGGILSLASGASATGADLQSGYILQVVYSGGNADNTTVNGLTGGGWQAVNSGGSATSTAVSGGGEQIVYAGASVSDSTVNSGAWLYLASGASLSGVTTVNQGTVQLLGLSASMYNIDNLVAAGGTVMIRDLKQAPPSERYGSIRHRRQWRRRLPGSSDRLWRLPLHPGHFVEYGRRRHKLADNRIDN